MSARSVCKGSWPCRYHSLRAISAPVHLDQAYAGRLQPLGQRLLQLQVFLQELGVTLLGEPARPPGLVESQPKSVRMNFLSHVLFRSALFRQLDYDMRRAPLVTVS